MCVQEKENFITKHTYKSIFQGRAWFRPLTFITLSRDRCNRGLIKIKPRYIRVIWINLDIKEEAEKLKKIYIDYISRTYYYRELAEMTSDRDECKEEIDPKLNDKSKGKY